MCGYIEIDGERPDRIQQFAESEIARQFTAKQFKSFYPAFGQNPDRKIDLVIEEDGEYKTVQATWWFDCFDSEEGTLVGSRITFNARNLDSPYWKDSLKTKRGLVFATGIGESKMVGKTKHQYYMNSDSVFVLGALYRKIGEGRYSCAVITRDAHEKMEPYHDKAFPCFLPLEDDFLKIWLDKSIAEHPRIDFVLNHPTLYPTLTVQRVKTYKGKVPYSSFVPVVLESDIA